MKDSSTLVLKNLPRLTPYAHPMGGFFDAFALPFEWGLSFFKKNYYPTENLVRPDEDFSRYHFLNPATVTVKLHSGEKLSASSMGPPGFAGTPEIEMEEMVFAKLASTGIGSAAQKRICDFALHLRRLDADAMKNFVEWFMCQL
ncbi:MAG TPA: hypothetical protein PLY93_15680 [Turneriella sp.]|nr:hypothetical protein [Turneriella sp.]